MWALKGTPAYLSTALQVMRQEVWDQKSRRSVFKDRKQLSLKKPNPVFDTNFTPYNIVCMSLFWNTYAPSRRRRRCCFYCCYGSITVYSLGKSHNLCQSLFVVSSVSSYSRQRYILNRNRTRVQQYLGIANWADKRHFSRICFAAQ